MNDLTKPSRHDLMIIEKRATDFRSRSKLGATGSIDLAGIAANQVHASNFLIG